MAAALPKLAAALPKMEGSAESLQTELSAASTRLVPLLDAAVTTSVALLQRDRGVLDQAAASAILQQQPMWGAALPRAAEVLLVGGGRCVTAVTYV